MAIVKKGSRQIVVDGVEYRWRVRRKMTYDQGLSDMSLACSVEQVVEKPGSILIIHFPQPHPRNWFGKKAVPILPSQVATGIRGALAQGWQPAQPGSPFDYVMPPALET